MSARNGRSLGPTCDARWQATGAHAAIGEPPPGRAAPARRAARRARGAVVAALFLASALLGCDGDAERRSVTRVTDPAEVAEPSGDQRIDQQLMVALALAKNFHHRAKVYMSDGNLPEAIDSVRRILSLRFPPAAAEAEDVRADARALLAKLMMGRGELDEAARIIEEGLADARRDSFFIANLYTVKGELHEALAAAADAQGAAGHAAASSQRREAIRAYDRAIAINSAIQRQLMEGEAP
jgi:tetratricopeptide (TPR) repeat protein